VKIENKKAAPHRAINLFQSLYGFLNLMKSAKKEKVNQGFSTNLSDSK
jgi:hypothetical protein